METKMMKFSVPKGARRRAVMISAAVVCAALVIAALAVVLSAGRDDRPFTAEFDQRNVVYTPRATKAAFTTRRPSKTTAPDKSDDDTTAAVSTAMPDGMRNGALKCRITMPKTAWSADETPTFTLDFGLTDASYGDGDLRLRLDCDDLHLSHELTVKDYIYDIHGFVDGKAPDSVELSFLRGKSADTAAATSDMDFAFGKLYLYFEFVPAEGNDVFGSSARYSYSDDDEDQEYGTTGGVWVGGFWCSYAITPCGISFARRDVDSADYFADCVIKQYRAGGLDADQLCEAYYLLAYDGITYISATPALKDGTTRVGYYSATLRAEAAEAVSDEELLALVSKLGPFYDTHKDDAREIMLSRGKELGTLVLGVLKDQGVITDEEYTAEAARLGRTEKVVTSLPEFDRKFGRYRKIIEEKLFTNE